jgi:hypothetical protein
MVVMMVVKVAVVVVVVVRVKDRWKGGKKAVLSLTHALSLSPLLSLSPFSVPIHCCDGLSNIIIYLLLICQLINYVHVGFNSFSRFICVVCSII